MFSLYNSHSDRILKSENILKIAHKLQASLFMYDYHSRAVSLPPSFGVFIPKTLRYTWSNNETI